jgi:hypothetical protein
MKSGAIFLLLFSAAISASAVIIDRIAIVVNQHIIKDSDINRDVRVTDFLNGAELNFGDAARKKAANRLLTQQFIRQEIRIGDYPSASTQQADKELSDLISNRFKTQTDFQQALSRYGLTRAELEMYFQWQLTVLDFIGARFKPAVYVTGKEVEAYYDAHAAALARKYPGKSPTQLREEAHDILAGEQVNKQFYSWLDQQRKNAKIHYLEESLQ